MHNDNNIFRCFLWVVTIEIIVTFISLFLIPSEQENAFLLGLSKSRLFLAAIVAIVSLVLGVISIWSDKRESLIITIKVKLSNYLIEKGFLIQILIVLTFSICIILIITVKILTISPDKYIQFEHFAPSTFPLLHSLFVRSLPVIIWVLVICIEFIFLLFLYFRPNFREKHFWKLSEIITAVFFTLVGWATLLQWGILLFQIQFFRNIPGWYWDINVKPFKFRETIVIAFIIALVALIFFARKKFLRTSGFIGLIYIFGVFMQFSFGFIEGKGVKSLNEKFFTRHHAVYSIIAANNTRSLMDNIKNYEELYGNSVFTNTKPPGLLTFHLVLERLVNSGRPNLTSDERFERLANVITWTFPFLSFIIILAIPMFAGRILKLDNGFEVGQISSMLFTLAPNTILIVLFMDQAVYPLLFFLLIALFIITFRQKSLVLAFFLGVVIYLALFLTFTVLPVLVFIPIYVGLEYWLNHKNGAYLHKILIVLSIGVGLLVAYILFRIFLDYDILIRLGKTIEINRAFDFYIRLGLNPPQTTISITERAIQTIKAAYLNIIEYATVVGIPLFSLFVFHGAHVIRSIFQRKYSQSTTILGSILFTLLVLILAGTTQGEVGRLWLFWLPFLVMMAGIELHRWISKNNCWPALVIFAAQFVTIFLTFHFQDLQM